MSYDQQELQYYYTPEQLEAYTEQRFLASACAYGFKDDGQGGCAKIACQMGYKLGPPGPDGTKCLPEAKSATPEAKSASACAYGFKDDGKGGCEKIICGQGFKLGPPGPDGTSCLPADGSGGIGVATEVKGMDGGGCMIL